MSRSLTRWQAAFLGALVLFGLTLALWGLFLVGDRGALWAEKFTLHAGFRRLEGVAIGTPVRVRGLAAGVVTAVELPAAGRPDEPLTLQLQLDRRFQPLIFTDAIASILQEGMIGARLSKSIPVMPNVAPSRTAEVLRFARDRD